MIVGWVIRKSEVISWYRCFCPQQFTWWIIPNRSTPMVVSCVRVDACLHACLCTGQTILCWRKVCVHFWLPVIVEIISVACQLLRCGFVEVSDQTSSVLESLSLVPSLFCLDRPLPLLAPPHSLLRQKGRRGLIISLPNRLFGLYVGGQLATVLSGPRWLGSCWGKLSLLEMSPCSSLCASDKQGRRGNHPLAHSAASWSIFSRTGLAPATFHKLQVFGGLTLARHVTFKRFWIIGQICCELDRALAHWGRCNLSSH